MSRILLFASVFVLFNSSAISVDTDTSLLLFYNVKKGDVFRYMMETKNDEFENGIGNDYKSEKSYEYFTYYYTKSAADIDESGTITFKVNIDSVFIFTGDAYSNYKKHYNSNNCFKNNLVSIDSTDFIQYYCMINEPFFVRTSKFGEVLDVYGFQPILKNIYKVYNDTLNDDEKESLKGYLGEDTFIDIFQTEILMFPQDGINNNKWIRKFNTTLVYMNCENTASYKIDNSDNGIYSISAGLKSKLLNKEHMTEDSVLVKISDYDISMTGSFSFDFNRGCIISKETSGKTALNVSLKTSEESGTSKNIVENKVKVQLLNE